MTGDLAALFPHEELILPGGLRTLLVHRPGLQRASISLFLRVGSRYEDARTNGLTCLVDRFRDRAHAGVDGGIHNAGPIHHVP